MHNILITGTSGLLGRFVADAYFHSGYNVCGIDRLAPASVTPWQHICAEATDPAILADLAKGCDALIHIAALPRPIGYASGDVFRINMTALYAALEAARLVNIKRFIYASSFSVLGYPFFEKPIEPDYLPIDEAHPIAPQDIYATTKWLGEEMVEAFVRRGAFDAISLRMPWLQSPESFSAQIRPRQLDTQKANLLAARDLWAYLDVRDAATAFVAALKANITGHQRLFLSATDTYMTKQTGELVEAFYPKSALKRPLLDHESLINCTRAQEILGFAPHFSWRDYR